MFLVRWASLFWPRVATFTNISDNAVYLSESVVLPRGASRRLVGYKRSWLKTEEYLAYLAGTAQQSNCRYSYTCAKPNVPLVTYLVIWHCQLYLQTMRCRTRRLFVKLYLACIGTCRCLCRQESHTAVASHCEEQSSKDKGVQRQISDSCDTLSTNGSDDRVRDVTILPTEPA